MLVEVQPKITEQIAPSPILQQTAYWAKVKEEHGYQTKAFDIKIKATENELPSLNTGNPPTDDILIVLRQVSPEFQIAYVPYGPVFEPGEENRGLYLEELSESIRKYLPKSCIAIRYDLVWESPWAGDEAHYNQNGEWIGPPETRIQEMRMNFDTQGWKLRKAHTNTLPSNTVFMDLNKKDETLLTQMKSKTRYNIRLSQRKGVQVEDVTHDNLPVWYNLYQETALRNGIVLDNMEYFKSVLEAQEQQPKQWAQIRMLLAKKDDEPLAGMFLAITGKRATYLYGASSNRKRNLMAPYALQWEAICQAKAAGCEEYDMFGVSDKPDTEHPMYGLYKFKTGFGGELHHRHGCWDYPLDPKTYELYRAVEMSGQGFHMN
ncbi:peptidoglycan bridge formation glycyltransferase FemA/FemB family protein [Limibacter armeniacum]|uniref:lipid II:glycine glycyltransferase FemX n=1 Tax=Limibacter armeniacum TaxID=466084 RepID=UPI002FE63E7E